MNRIFVALTVICLTLVTMAAIDAAQVVTWQRHADGAVSDAESSNRAAPETWYRIHLSELDRGQWRSAGTFENPSRDNCLRYGRGWVEGGKPGTRKFTGPFSFNR